MRGFGAKHVVTAQMPDVDGFIGNTLGILYDGLKPFYLHHGDSRHDKPPHMVFREGHTHTLAALLGVCSYFEQPSQAP